MYDISAARNFIITVAFRGEGSEGDDGTKMSAVEFKPRDFADDTPPLQYVPVQTAAPRVDLNRRLFQNRQFGPTRVILSPIPLTKADKELKKLILASRRLNSVNVNGYVDKITVKADGYQLEFSNGTISDGIIGTTLSPEGRLATPQYTFDFADATLDISQTTAWSDLVEDSAGLPQVPPSSLPSGGDKSSERRKQRLLLTPNAFTPLTNSGRQMMVPNWKSPLSNNRWFS